MHVRFNPIEPRTFATTLLSVAAVKFFHGPAHGEDVFDIYCAAFVRIKLAPAVKGFTTLWIQLGPEDGKDVEVLSLWFSIGIG